MFTKNFKRKYALSDKGVSNTKKGTVWTVIVNLVVMGGMGILYFLMEAFMKSRTEGENLPPAWIFLSAVAGFVILSLVTHLQQYRSTYGLVYGEVKHMRISLAERLRQLPLSFFGKRDLADLTETIMSDVNRMEHVWSHVLGYMYGSYISTVIIALMLAFYGWRLALACLWGVPVAFALLFASRKMAEKNAADAKKASLVVSDGMQETIENIREIHATNQEEKYLSELDRKIDLQEKSLIHGELATGIFVNAASVIMRLGVATTILTGATLILSGGIDFMTLFMFLLVITRIYAPFDQSLALIAEVFLSEVSAERLMEIQDAKSASGSEEFKPNGHDIVFENVSFSYDDGKVLDGVTFTAKEGEVTALVGPSGSGKSTCARLAARLWDATAGKIKVGGIDISTVEPETLLTDYAMVFQDVVLFDDTVMENIRLGKHGASDEEVIQAAKAANCDDFVSRLPDGYGTKIGENGAKLSGGER
ncbi:MAG: ABC transporter ATP-binding protein, partial [Treponema sp.]|uniref:ABC transporter ATP-binding protein n=1 Tax=Treponema sp. TaxID=166 RepID=UPI0025F54B71